MHPEIREIRSKCKSTYVCSILVHTRKTKQKKKKKKRQNRRNQQTLDRLDGRKASESRTGDGADLRSEEENAISPTTKLFAAET